jgi:hypothetical protein
MPRFQKTRVHWLAAGFFLFGLYALAGLVYAAVAHGQESVITWAIVAVIAFTASFVWQRVIARRRARNA